MPSPVHGHEVIAMIRETPEVYTRESLAAAVVARFGAATRFFTCSAQDLTAEQLVDFLAERRKFVPQGESFAVDPACGCRH